MRYIIGYTFLLLTSIQLWARADADSADINLSTIERYSERAVLLDRYYGQTTANRYFQYGSSLGCVTAGWNFRYEKNASAPWHGDRASTGEFAADSYLRFGNKAVAFIQAGYENGILYDVDWNSTSDYELLYPYVLIASEKGNVHHESYSFSGGYAGRAGQWIYGLRGAYRALHEYRRIDPRPRSKVNDLEAELSFNRIIGEEYSLGAAADIRIYKQIMDVKYFNEAGAFVPQYHYLGLGQTFGRFDGTTYTETRHKGFGYGCRLSLVPTGKEGIIVMSAYSRLKMNRQLQEINEAPITVLWTDRCEAGLAYSWKRREWNYTLSLYGNYERRQGEESVVDNGLMGEFKILDRHSMYDRHRYSAILNAVVEWSLKNNFVTIAPEARIESEKETYKDPTGMIARISLSAGGLVGYRRMTGAWLFSTAISCAYTTSPSKRFSIPAKTMSNLGEHLSYKHLRDTDNCIALQPQFSAQRKFQKSGAVFISLSYRQLFHSFGVSLSAQISLGYRF